VPEIIAPIVYALPIQMLAYHTAVFMGTDVDQPRNLAKSVTVEIARPIGVCFESAYLIAVACAALIGCIDNRDKHVESHRTSGMTRLRNYFLTGIFIVCAPLAITAYLAWSFIGWVDSWVKPYIPARYNPDTYLPFAVPGVGLIVALFLIT
jgi:hypothetical protein